MTAGIRVSVTQPSGPASMEHNTWLSFDFSNMNSPVIFAGPAPVTPGDGVETTTDNIRTDTLLCCSCCDLELDQMTLIYDLDLFYSRNVDVHQKGSSASRQIPQCHSHKTYFYNTAFVGCNKQSLFHTFIWSTFHILKTQISRDCFYG